MKNDTELKEVLTKNSDEGEDALLKQALWWERQIQKRNQGCLLPLDFYNKFRLNSKVISYANLKPRMEPRLQEIYRKF